MAEPAPAPVRRSGFGPVVLLGLASAGLAAVATAKPWIGSSTPSGHADATLTALDTGTRYPLASAVSLVLLASWGVLLVTRGRVRRVFAVLAAVAALALVVTVVVGYLTLPDTARDSVQQVVQRQSDGGWTGWFWTSAVAAVVALVPAGLAVRRVGEWPEMGSRYDAPVGSAEARNDPVVDGERDLWRALDEGRDPTRQDHP